MGNIFNLDSPLMRFLSRLADIMILNALFLICCLPIITIGASWTAMSYVHLKMVRNEESYIVRSFFKSFRQNFRQATVIWLITLVTGFVMYLDFNIMRAMESAVSRPMLIALTAIGLLMVMTLLFVFPVLAKFDNTILHTIKNAFLMAVSNLPRTLLITILTVGSPILLLINSTTLSWGLLFFLLCGFSVIGFVNAMQFVKIFDRYIPKEEPDSEASLPEQAKVDSSVFRNLHPTEQAETDESASQNLSLAETDDSASQNLSLAKTDDSASQNLHPTHPAE